MPLTDKDQLEALPAVTTILSKARSALEGEHLALIALAAMRRLAIIRRTAEALAEANATGLCAADAMDAVVDHVVYEARREAERELDRRRFDPFAK